MARNAGERSPLSGCDAGGVIDDRRRFRADFAGRTFRPALHSRPPVVPGAGKQGEAEVQNAPSGTSSAATLIPIKATTPLLNRHWLNDAKLPPDQRRLCAKIISTSTRHCSATTAYLILASPLADEKLWVLGPVPALAPKRVALALADIVAAPSARAYSTSSMVRCSLIQ